MRLIHTQSFLMKDFFDDAIPKYAILSHKWGSKETSYQEYENTALKKRSSFTKIRGLCTLARSRRWEWVWIDTCCIDKKSSAELSEAINSMYRWYRQSAECYVYLSDVKWNSKDIINSSFNGVYGLPEDGHFKNFSLLKKWSSSTVIGSILRTKNGCPTIYQL